jgi:hypothetical protein
MCPSVPWQRRPEIVRTISIFRFVSLLGLNGIGNVSGTDERLATRLLDLAPCRLETFAASCDQTNMPSAHTIRASECTANTCRRTSDHDDFRSLAAIH